MRRLAAALSLLLALAAPAAADELRPFSRGSWAELRAAHAGRPTVVALWSVHCPPCIAEMPLWKKLAHEIDVVLVSSDSIEEVERIGRTLHKHGVAGLENWAFADAFVERLRFEIDPAWRGELPRTYLIAADGGLTAHSGLIDETELRHRLRGGSDGAGR
jgi:thiol-disulfide isomerase/thioredoxin